MTRLPDVRRILSSFFKPIKKCPPRPPPSPSLAPFPWPSPWLNEISHQEEERVLCLVNTAMITCTANLCRMCGDETRIGPVVELLRHACLAAARYVSRSALYTTDDERAKARKMLRQILGDVIMSAVLVESAATPRMICSEALCAIIPLTWNAQDVSLIGPPQEEQATSCLDVASIARKSVDKVIKRLGKRYFLD
jgi:hypothetical protein